MPAFFTGEKVENLNAWSDYWKLGELTSFGDRKGKNYSGLIRARWKAFFEQLDDGSCVLDVCTGNASIIRLAYELDPVKFKLLQFIGIDYADIPDDSSLFSLKNVQIMSGIDVEALPFEAAKFDAVISNFGIEYSNLDSSLKEVARVLKANGKVHFITHSASSILISKSSRTESMLKLIMADGGPLETLIELRICLIKNGKGERSEKLRNSLNQQMDLLLKKDEDALFASDFPSLLKYCFSPRVTDQLKQLQDFKVTRHAFLTRLTAMTRSALDEDKVNYIKALFAELFGNKLNSEALIDNGQHTAICLHN